MFSNPLLPLVDGFDRGNPNFGIFEFIYLHEREVARFIGAIFLLILGGILVVVFHLPSGIG